MYSEDQKKLMFETKIHALAEQAFLIWLQTGLFLISIGIASVGIISFLESQQYHRLAITLISLIGDLFTLTGFITVIAALIQYRAKIKHIDKPYVPKFGLALFTGTMTSLLGILTFITLLIEMFL